MHSFNIKFAAAGKIIYVFEDCDYYYVVLRIINPKLETRQRYVELQNVHCP